MGQEHDAQRQREMQQWKQATEGQYHKLVEETVARRVAEELEALGIKDRPRKKPRAAVRDNGRRCSVCGSAGTGRDVHRHRELAIDLDGKCRKQVETFRHGGVLKDRREEWLATLIATDNQSELSRNMIAALSEPSKSDSKGRSPALSSTSLPSASPSADSMAVEASVGTLNLSEKRTQEEIKNGVELSAHEKHKRGVFLTGQCAGAIEDILPAKTIVENMVLMAAEQIQQMQGFVVSR